MNHNAKQDQLLYSVKCEEHTMSEIFRTRYYFVPDSEIL